MMKRPQRKRNRRTLLWGRKVWALFSVEQDWIQMLMQDPRFWRRPDVWGKPRRKRRRKGRALRRMSPKMRIAVLLPPMRPEWVASSIWSTRSRWCGRGSPALWRLRQSMKPGRICWHLQGLCGRWRRLTFHRCSHSMGGPKSSQQWALLWRKKHLPWRSQETIFFKAAWQLAPTSFASASRALKPCRKAITGRLPGNLNWWNPKGKISPMRTKLCKRPEELEKNRSWRAWQIEDLVDPREMGDSATQEMEEERKERTLKDKGKGEMMSRANGVRMGRRMTKEDGRRNHEWGRDLS